MNKQEYTQKTMKKQRLFYVDFTVFISYYIFMHTQIIKLPNRGKTTIKDDAIVSQLGNDLIVQQVTFFRKDKKIHLRIYNKDIFFALEYVHTICHSNQFIKENRDRQRLLFHTLELVSRKENILSIPKRFLPQHDIVATLCWHHDHIEILEA